jgi:hypothetical protein
MNQNYKEQIVHLIGGVNEWVGEFDSSEHKNGADWIRLKNPCRVAYINSPNGGQGIKLMSAYNAGSLYKQYVDIRIPSDSIVEVLTLLKDGGLMEAYLKESTREKSTIIQPVNGGSIRLV